MMNNLEVLEEVTSIKLKESNYKIYCDMDGVLTDFDKQFTDSISSYKPKQFIDKNGLNDFWEEIDGRGVGFWVGMKWMEDGKELFEFLKNYNDVELLSSPSRSENSRLGKRLWVRNHKLGIKLNLEYSKNKQKYAAWNHILIDDRIDNIKDWESKGGIGILHMSTKNTIACLKKLAML